MSSKGYATPLRIEVAANRLLRRLYLAFVVLTLSVLPGLPLSLYVTLPGAALFLWMARRQWRLRPELGGEPVSLVWDAEQRWWWSQGARTVELQLLGDSYLSAVLVALNFRPPESRRRRSLLLTPVGIGEENFRRLQVRFRLTGEEAVTAAKPVRH
ncbi:MAG: hypothetical protein OQL05_12110 [Gammaproteobacteria bacterium]|nr:hypothetical protein [Gammaproteobacteria bacterium]MCW8958712.1 hypothetical protein [Gammaproteobacteria bacterium]MCW8974003.1 hypothetical protein [Gammaproteobacteria bacterium]MCW8993523.1 hypothetical protein [Gammaproteobacteria bacterium]